MMGKGIGDLAPRVAGNCPTVEGSTVVGDLAKIQVVGSENTRPRAWLLIAMAATMTAMVAGCDPRPLRHGAGAGGPGGGSGTGGTGGVAQGGTGDTYQLVPAPVRKLDLLIVVDRSAGMEVMQAKLAAQLPVLIDVLKMLPTRGGYVSALPSLHLGVISADTGAGGFDLPARGCPFHGDRGQFRIGGTPGCPTSPLTPRAPLLRYLIADDNQTQRNYNGDIGDAASCLVRLGESGCMVSSPLEAARWALDPLNPPTGNEGFLRPDAGLQILILTRQDDCSLVANSTLFDPRDDSLTSGLGPFTPFRCAESGYVCNSGTIGSPLGPLSRVMAQSNVVCHPNESSPSMITKVADEVAFLKGLKAITDDVFVSVIAGPTTPFGTALTPHVETNGAVEMVPAVLPSCTVNAQQNALPAVRLDQLVQNFGNRGLLETICSPSFAPTLSPIAQSLSLIDPPQCLASNTRDANPATPDIDADCTVVDHVTGPDGGVTTTPVPSCAGSLARPCWTAEPNSLCPGLGLAISRTADAPAGTTTTASCQICPPGAHLSGCP